MKKIIVILMLSVLVFIACDNGGTTYTNEGSIASPVVLTVGTPHSATIAPFGVNYYKFTTAAAANHTISLINVDSDLSWDLYANSDYTGFIDSCDDYWDATDESATVFLGTIGTYYLLVDEWDFVGGAFTVSVTSP